MSKSYSDISKDLMKDREKSSGNSKDSNKNQIPTYRTKSVMGSKIPEYNSSLLLHNLNRPLDQFKKD